MEGSFTFWVYKTNEVQNGKDFAIHLTTLPMPGPFSMALSASKEILCLIINKAKLDQASPDLPYQENSVVKSQWGQVKLSPMP